MTVVESRGNETDANVVGWLRATPPPRCACGEQGAGRAHARGVVVVAPPPHVYGGDHPSVWVVRVPHAGQGFLVTTMPHVG